MECCARIERCERGFVSKRGRYGDDAVCARDDEESFAGAGVAAACIRRKENEKKLEIIAYIQGVLGILGCGVSVSAREKWKLFSPRYFNAGVRVAFEMMFARTTLLEF